MATDRQPPAASVWTSSRRSRRERPRLNRDRVVAEGVRLLDEEGVEALSMRRLGASLGVAPTSLYTYVATKDELIELIVDVIYGELPLPELGDATRWQQALADCAKAMRTAMLRHPWIASVLGSTGMANFGPNLMRLSERILALLRAAGFTLLEANSVLTAVFSYVIGATASEAAWRTKLNASGQTDEQWLEQTWPAVEDAVKAHPNLSVLYNPRSDRALPRSREEEFFHGLERLLDGLSATTRDEPVRPPHAHS